MAQLSDDCFAFGGQLMSVDEAVHMIARTLEPVTALEHIVIDEADGRVLWQDVRATLSSAAIRQLGGRWVGGCFRRSRPLG